MDGIVTAIMVPHPPLIIPEVGNGGEKQIQKTVDAYREAAKRLAAERPETIVVLSPHQTMYADYFHISPGTEAAGNFERFGAPQICFKAEYDIGLVDALCAEAKACGIPAGTLGEREKMLDHGTIVPLYFVNPYLSDYKLVRIGLSGLPLLTHYEFGQCIRRAAEKSGKRVAVIASGDLSHKLKEDGPYGFAKEGPEYDARIMDVMKRAAFDELFDFSEDFCNRAAECGHRSFVIMAGALDGTAVEAEMLSHEDVTGVGYGICTYRIAGSDENREFGARQKQREIRQMEEHRANEDAYVRFARSVIEEYIRTGTAPKLPRNLPEELYRTRAGAFVSIKKNGNLRGCIGTITATQETLAEEILANAICAATQDPRFSPITADELERLIISVDVLGEAEDIASPDELDVVRYGVIVAKGGSRGLLLPNLEGVDTIEEQLRIAKQKAGIRADDDDVKLQRFEVVRHYLRTSGSDS